LLALATLLGTAQFIELERPIAEYFLSFTCWQLDSL